MGNLEQRPFFYFFQYLWHTLDAVIRSVLMSHNIYKHFTRPAHTVRPVRFWPYHFSSSVVGVAHFPSCVVQAMITNNLAFATQLRIQCCRGRAVGRDPERQWWVYLIKRF